MTALARPATSLGRMLLVPGAFFRRDRQIETSYRAGLILRLGSAVVTIGVFFFLSRTFDAAAPGLMPAGTTYFAFVLIGIVAQEFLSSIVGGFSGSLRESMTTGTLELMLLGRARLSTVLISSTLWLQLSAALGAAAYLVFGTALGVDLSSMDVPAALLGLLLMNVGFMGMAFLAGAVVLLIKRGNPLGWALRGASVVLGGTLYPVEVLPPVLQALGVLLPMTHALRVLRGAMLHGLGVPELASQLALLAVVSLAYLALGLAACAAAIRHARNDGSLAEY